MVAILSHAVIKVAGTAAVRPQKAGDEWRLYGSSSGYVGFVPQAAAGSQTYILPAADGVGSLTSDGLGNLSWAVSGGGGDALVANPLSQFAATTSAQLAGVISDETGSGALVFATSPTFVTPLLGTPTSGVLTNCTGLPMAAIVGAGTANQILYSDGTKPTSSSSFIFDTNGLSVLNATDAATALFYNPTVGLGTRVTIRGQSGNANGGLVDPVLSIRNRSDVQVAAIREDGLIASSQIATLDDDSVALVDSSVATSAYPKGVNLAHDAIIGWGSSNWYTTKDVWIDRTAAGVIRVVTPTGRGSLLVSNINVAALSSAAAIEATANATPGTLLDLNLSAGNVFRVDSTGFYSIANAAEGGTARCTIKTAREQHTLAAAATSDTTTISIPSGARLIGVSFNVDTAVVDTAGDDTWSAAFITGSTTTLATAAAPAQNTQVDTMLPDEISSGVCQIRFTANAGTFSAGVIEVVAYYSTLTSLANA